MKIYMVSGNKIRGGGGKKTSTSASKRKKRKKPRIQSTEDWANDLPF